MIVHIAVMKMQHRYQHESKPPVPGKVKVKYRVLSCTIATFNDAQSAHHKKKPSLLKQKSQNQQAAIPTPSGVWQLCSKSVPNRADYNICTTCEFKSNNTGTITNPNNADNPVKTIHWKIADKKLLIHFTVDENKKPVGEATIFIWNSNEKCFYSQPEAWGPEGTVMSVHKLKK